jgi:hypothetical protein
MFAPWAADVKNTRMVPFARMSALMTPPPRQTIGKLSCGKRRRVEHSRGRPSSDPSQDQRGSNREQTDLAHLNSPLSV